MASYGEDWDIMPIGGHSYLLHQDEMNAKTLHKEYYYKEKNGTVHIVPNPTKREARFARLTSPITKKLAGYVSESVVDKYDFVYYEVKEKEKLEANNKANNKQEKEMWFWANRFDLLFFVLI